MHLMRISTFKVYWGDAIETRILITIQSPVLFIRQTLQVKTAIKHVLVLKHFHPIIWDGKQTSLLCFYPNDKTILPTAPFRNNHFTELFRKAFQFTHRIVKIFMIEIASTECTGWYQMRATHAADLAQHIFPISPFAAITWTCLPFPFVPGGLQILRNSIYGKKGGAAVKGGTGRNQ